MKPDRPQLFKIRKGESVVIPWVITQPVRPVPVPKATVMFGPRVLELEPTDKGLKVRRVE